MPLPPRRLRQRRQRRQARAAADRDDVAPCRIEREADAERAHDVERVAGAFKRASPRVPAPATL
jgi:hypothetical protein